MALRARVCHWLRWLLPSKLKPTAASTLLLWRGVYWKGVSTVKAIAQPADFFRFHGGSAGARRPRDAPTVTQATLAGSCNRGLHLA